MADTDGLSWEELAQRDLGEFPFEPLAIDPARWSPVTMETKLLRIANSLVTFRRLYGENQKEITLLGTRTGERYKQVRSDQIVLESKIKSLEDKRSAISELMWNKRQERKETS